MCGEKNVNCKIKDCNIMNMLFLFYLEHKTPKEIVENYNTTKKYVQQVVTGKKRKNLFYELKKILNNYYQKKP